MILLFKKWGLEKYRSVLRTYYNGVDAALIVYDVTKKESFSSVSLWFEELSDNCSSFPQIVLILIGNKTDLEAK